MRTAKTRKRRARPWDRPKATGYNTNKSNKGKISALNRWTAINKCWRTANPICATEGCETICLVNGGVTDHIIPVIQGGAGYSKANFQSLCHSCHNRKSRLEQIHGILYEYEYTEKGLKIPKRTEAGELIRIGGGGVIKTS